MQYQPYTYLIGWPEINKFYYGVRYAKNCNPSDLWIKYFTSSRAVKQMRLTHGEPSIIQIRKVFATAVKARIWETKVLTRLKVVSRLDFLNENDSPAPPINNRIMLALTKNKISRSNKGKPKSELHRQKIKEARAKQINTRAGVPVSDETKKLLSAANKGKKYSDSTNSKKGARGSQHWAYGKERSDKTKQLLSKANKGKKLNAATRQKISDAFKNKPILTCPYCNATGKQLSMTRHHFNNCKFKGNDENN
jgi:hypothetical protein